MDEFGIDEDDCGLHKYHEIHWQTNTVNVRQAIDASEQQ